MTKIPFTEVIQVLQEAQECTFWEVNKRQWEQYENYREMSFQFAAHKQYNDAREMLEIAERFHKLVVDRFSRFQKVRWAICGKITPVIWGELPSEQIDFCEIDPKKLAKTCAIALAEVMQVAKQPPEGEKPTQSAKPILHGWRAIDEALGLSQIYTKMNYDERRRKLASLNCRFDGPIKTGKQGSQPVVNRSELITWWNSLEDQAEATKARIDDKQATVESRHPYGRTAEVAPDLGGSVRRRKSSSQT